MRNRCGWLLAAGLIGGLIAVNVEAVIRVVDTAQNPSSNDAALASGGSWTGGRHWGGPGTIHAEFLPATATVKPLGRRDFSLQVTYDVSGNSSVWFIESIGSDWGNVDVDLGAYSYFSFWVRGAVGGEGFQIGLGNASFVESRVQVNQYLPNGITTQWQKVVIPFRVLESGTSLTRAAVSKIVWVADSADLYGAASGTVYLDDITFGAAAAPVWIDNYNRGNTPNACKANNAAFGPDLSFGYSSLTSTTAPYSFRCGYSQAASEGVFVHYLNGVDLSQCTTLQVDVLGSIGGENPDIRLASTGADISLPLANYVTIVNSAFRTAAIPIADFSAPSNFSSSNECDLVINLSDTRSTLYLDNLRAVDTSIPAAPTALTFDGAAVNNGFVIGSLSGALAVTASSLNTDAKMEGVRFEYSADGGATWTTIADDYSTAAAKNTFSGTWGLSTLPNGNYLLRAQARHVGGTSADLTRSVVLNYGTPTVTPSVTATASITPTLTQSATYTPTPSITSTSTISATYTTTPSVTATPTITLTSTISATYTQSPTFTTSPTRTPPATRTPSSTASATFTRTPVVSPSPTPIPLRPDIRLGRNSFNPMRGQVLPVRLQVNTPGRVKATLFTRQGAKVRVLIDREATAGVVLEDWDGRDHKGTVVGTGIYILFVETPDQEFKRLVAVVH